MTMAVAVALLAASGALGPVDSEASTKTGGSASWCEPAPGLRAQLEALDPRGVDDCSPREACWQKLIEEARAYRGSHDDDLFVHLAYQRLVAAWEESLPWDQPRPLRNEYQERARREPKSAVAAYLAAQVTTDPAERRKRLESCVRLDPSFPFAYLDLAALDSRSPGSAATSELARFMSLCPGRWTDVLSLQRSVADDPFWRGRLAALRRGLAEAPVLDQVSGYPALWDLEFRLTPPSDHEALRKVVRQDLLRLEGFDLVTSPAWWAARKAGVELTGGPDELRRFEDDVVARRPLSVEAATVLVQRWRAAHPQPGSGAAHGEQRNYWRALFDATSGWLQRLSGNFLIWKPRLDAIANLPDLPAHVVEKNLEEALDAFAPRAGRGHFAESPFAQIARIRVGRGLGLERVPELVDREIAYHRFYRRSGKRAPAADAERNGYELADAMDVARLAPLAARAYGELGQHQAEAEAASRATRALRRAKELQSGMGAAAEHTAGLIAAAEQEVLAMEHDEEPEAGAAALRNDAGETARSAEWQASTERLAPFSLDAVDGARWTSDELHGKVAVIAVWATWCAPCREELRNVQELARRTASRWDVVVLTLNVDESVGSVGPFAERHGFHFPILLGGDYVKKLYGEDVVSLPRCLIVDPTGMIRFDLRGYDPAQAADWVGLALDRIDSLRRSEARSDRN